MCFYVFLALLLSLAFQGEVTPEDTSPVVITIDGEEITGDMVTDLSVLEREWAIYYVNTQINTYIENGDANDLDTAFSLAVRTDALFVDNWNLLTRPNELANRVQEHFVNTAILRRTAAELEIDAIEVDEPYVAFIEEVESSALQAFIDERVLYEALMPLVTDVEPIEYLVDSRHIMVETENEALEILDLLEDGESFADLAEERSLDTGSASRGGDLGVAPARLYVTPYAEAVINGEIGELLGPVESQFGFHIIEVLSREEAEMDEDTFAEVQREAMDEWLAEQSGALEVVYEDDWQDFISDTPEFEYLAPDA